jgi:hypothetical protein
MAETQATGRSDGWLRRKRKFDEMSADLSSVLAGKKDRILCPLCLNEFDENDIETNLTEEHVIPSSADGRVTTLTCRPCNSACGSEIDSHFARVFRIEEARQTGGPIDARIKIRNSVGSPVQVSFTENGLHCRLEPTTPYVRDVLMERLARYAKGERELNFAFTNNVDSSKLVASMIKAAYLGLFVDWGYRYVLLPNTEWVRIGIKRSGVERENLEQLVIPATIIDAGELPATPTRMSFSAVCSGVNVSCSIINGVLGPGAFWALLPPIFDLNAGSFASLRRAAESIRGKSLTITFNGDGPAVIQENS